MERKSKASTRAKDKYNSANYDQVKIWVKKGERERLDAIAEKAGLSRNAYILESIEEKIDRDKQKEQ
ncbi:transcriptional regulator [Paenibacillus kribbensis]|uniref:transcriptional regulator n=1 Tax=Paenibacillus kribbensis TaxID=172713 RepID=UPI002109339B|nr:transcriptional regulator [Paenibacillus kribbensis]